MNLRQLGEDRLLARFVSHLPLNRKVIAGAGDDCAVVDSPRANELLLLKTDCVVEGVHFAPRTPARSVGWKAMARPLSDFAAMSGVPQFALVTLIAAPATPAAWVKALYTGLAKIAALFDVSIVGGETSATAGPTVVSVSVAGFAEKQRWVSRSGAKPGDELFVTGRLGGSLGGRHLRFRPRIAEARWLTEHFSIDAMLDLSDGIGADLPRLATASGVGFEIDQGSLPRNRGCTLAQAVGDGEDYELLFAVAPETSAALQAKWRKRWSLKLTRIGHLTARRQSPSTLPRGYVHFQQR